MATTQHTARKSHPCLSYACGCSGMIQPGETYLRQFVPPDRNGEGRRSRKSTERMSTIIRESSHDSDESVGQESQGPYRSAWPTRRQDTARQV